MSLSNENTNASQKAIINLTKENLNTGKVNIIFQSILNKIKNNKNKLMLSSLLFGVMFYIYKKYISSKVQSAMEFYNTISECKDLFGENNNSFDQVIKQ